MSKHLRAWTQHGYTFGMDVDGKRATSALKKARYILKDRNGYTYKEHVIDSPYVAMLMGEVAWMVTEIQDFTHIQIDDGIRYRVIYPQQKVET